jgi:SPP1 family predicted phage head-tail adaptor
MEDKYLIDSGDMRFRADIQVVTKTKDTKGQLRETWATVATRWMSIAPASGQRFTASEQIRNSISHVICLRYYEGLRPLSYRILYLGRVFNIASVLNENELNVRHTVLATEVIPPPVVEVI